MTLLNFVSLVLVATMVSTASAQGGIASCCRNVSSTQIQRDLLKNYYVQEQPACARQIVVFTTLKGKRICSDPTNLWTQMSMAYLDGKNWHRQNLTSHGRRRRH
ncbi:monocyte chemotactic protein 1B-like [Hippoglossus stenolepis]|uniref:monocyte chemotactic protein 1B-like n=1 Tax=Hippoglossus stenolepis TaxID=195615 RepID=UPI00159CAD8A|nr:monocyte chemotactic protein 1B-like [Hippoglossus stenolepis]